MKRVLITGAASGIGAETARQLRAGGARVIGLDLRGDGPELLACDVRDQGAVEAAVGTAVERLQGLDVLINCAGIGPGQSAAEAPGESALAALDINLLGPWRVSAAAMPALRDAGGRVLNIASGLSHVAFPFAPAYCMSKRGLVAYSDALRYEVGPDVSVTTIYPGYVRTPIHDASAEQGFGLEGLVPAEPLEAVARRIVRAALGRPVRDLATTRMGTLNYAVLRRLPRRLVDSLVLGSLRRQARSGRFDDSPLAGKWAQGLREPR